ncbi:MAG: glycosyltransferase, partial [Candidatus Eisenbacteria bacterium]|nr:glycosyltransferase [Candidatus Eisenbacteria bacterium]
MSELPPVWIIIPTYDELENVKTLVPDLLSRGSNIDVLVVDDNSPDGTGRWVEEFGRTVPRVHVLHRPRKMGLGSAYRDGFRFALEQGAELIFEMDADYSHDPSALPSFFEAAREADLVLG